MIVLFFCFITTFIVYYDADPGNMMHHYFGTSVIFLILLALFSFLYMIILLTLPDATYKNNNRANFLENFTSFSSIGSILFLLFFILLAVSIHHNGDFLKNKSLTAIVIILVLLISILWSVLLGGSIFPEISNFNGTNNRSQAELLNLFKRGLLILFAFIILGIFMFMIIKNTTNPVKWGFNILILFIILFFIYKIFIVRKSSSNNNNNNNNNKSSIFVYLLSIFDFLKKDIMQTSKTSLLILLVTILSILIYFLYPIISDKLKGQILLDKAINLDKIKSLKSYEELNGNDLPHYAYSLSVSFYLDSTPNTNSSFHKYSSILNYGEKPNILYNAEKNELMITIKQKDLENHEKNKEQMDFDQNGNRILYKKKNMLLQKWNDILINYSNGIMDIFLNGELVNSSNNVVPYFNLDNLTVGENDGIKGGIRNVIYNKK
jgi:hypothetical protein